VDELVELAAVLLEGNGSGDDLERFLDGASRLCDQRSEDLKREASGVLRRAREILAEHTWSPAVSSARRRLDPSGGRRRTDPGA
jgi:hypothetical protein